MDQKKEEYRSKQKALELWDSGYIDEIEVGTTKGLQDIHRYLFSDIEGYDAGKIRKVNISKSGFLFASSLYLEQALHAVEDLSENNFSEIIDKYVEMNIAHPFIEGNGRTTRIWLDQILKKHLNVCVDWEQINKEDYLNFMKLSPTNNKYIKQLLNDALTDKINDREVFMKGLDRSYEYEDMSAYQTSDIDIKEEQIEPNNNQP